MTTVPTNVACPWCDAPIDVSMRITGDQVWCKDCGGIVLVRHLAGGRSVLLGTVAPPQGDAPQSPEPAPPPAPRRQGGRTG